MVAHSLYVISVTICEGYFLLKKIYIYKIKSCDPNYSSVLFITAILLHRPHCVRLTVVSDLIPLLNILGRHSNRKEKHCITANTSISKLSKSVDPHANSLYPHRLDSCHRLQHLMLCFPYSVTVMPSTQEERYCITVNTKRLKILLEPKCPPSHGSRIRMAFKEQRNATHGTFRATEECRQQYTVMNKTPLYGQPVTRTSRSSEPVFYVAGNALSKYSQ